MTDTELVDQARRGDQAAFGELVDRHRDVVLRTALASLGSREDAEEVAQDAFVAAYRGLAGFRAEASFRTWVTTIAWRRALTRRGGLAHRLRRLTGSAGNPWPEPAATNPSVEQSLAGAETASAVRRLIASLPPKLRDALLVAVTGELPYRDAAAVLGVPVGTLKWRVTEARRLLRDKMRARGLIDE